MAEQNALLELSTSLKSAVKKVRPGIVKILDGTRLTASGIVWDSEGHIVATSHGVERDEDLQVEFDDGVTVPATVVGRDPESDIALLKITGVSVEPIKRADLEEAGPGSIVLAIGRPGHAGLQVTMGVVSSLRKDDKIIVTDAKLYPGFSGGALVDAEGNLIGMLNLSFGRGRGISVAHSAITEVVASLATGGSVKRGYLGVSTQPVDLGSAAKSLSGAESGLLVSSVAEGSPAEQAGLLLGDVMLEVDGNLLADPRELRRLLASRKAGEQVSIKVLRAAEIVELQAKLGARN